MRSAPPLPSNLHKRAFTAAQLTRCGVDRRRAYRRDVLPLGSGVFILRSVADEQDEHALYRMKALALARDVPEGWLSHSTAARLRGFPLPLKILTDSTIHISFTPELGARRTRRGITAHSSGRGAAGTTVVHGIRQSEPARVWVEMAAQLSVEELVILGDHLVRHPYCWAEQRDEPHCTVEDLRRALEAYGKFRGKVAAARALGLVRVGSDSPQETRFRLALIKAGLPEPQLQAPLNPNDPQSRWEDAGYPQHRVAIQYDGAGHFNPQQARKDQRRDNEFVAEGWLVLRFNVEDDREGFATAIRQVAAALEST